jgi:hypothetical protein
MSMHVPETQSFAGKIWSELKDFKERHSKDDRVETEEVNPFQNLVKMSVLMEARAFNDSNFVRMHPKRCCQHLTKLLWFFAQSDPVSGPESREWLLLFSELAFSVVHFCFPWPLMGAPPLTEKTRVSQSAAICARICWPLRAGRRPQGRVCALRGAVRRRPRSSRSRAAEPCGPAASQPCS